MGRARDEAGNIWETDAQGNPVRLVQQGQPQMPTDPAFPYQGAQAQAQAANTGADAAVNQATIQAQIAAAEAEATIKQRQAQTAGLPEGFQWSPGGQAAAPITGYTRQGLSPEIRANAIQAFNDAGALERAADELTRRFREGPGKTKGIWSFGDFLPTSSNRVFDDTGQQARGYVKRALGFTGGEGNTVAESSALYNPYLPTSWDTDEQIQVKIRKLRELAQDARNKSTMTLGGVPDASGNIQPNAMTQIRQSGAQGLQAAGTGARTGADPIPPELSAAHDQLVARMMQENGGRLDPAAYAKAQSELLAGTPFATDPAASEAWAQSINDYLDRGGRTVPGGLQPKERELTGTERFRNDMVSNPIGAAMVGGADMAGFGGVSALAPEQMAALSGEQPLAMTLGQIGGAVVGTGMLSSAARSTAGRLFPQLLGGSGKAAFARNLGTDVAYSGAYGGVSQGDPLSSAVEGGVGSVGGQAVGRLGGALLGGLRTSPAVQRLRQAGVRTTVGQNLGGLGKSIEDAATSIPVVGDVVNARRLEGLRDFNQAAFREAGSPIGATVRNFGEEGVQELIDQAGNAYDSATAGVTVSFDPQFVGDMGLAESMGSALPDDLAPRFNRAIENRVWPATDPGELTGEAYQQAFRGLKGYRSETTKPGFEQDYRDALTLAMDALTSQMQRGGGEQVVTGLRNADQAYRGAKTLQRAVQAAKNGTGSGEIQIFTPAQLNTAATQAANKYGGGRQMADLIDAGQSTLPSRLPDSGTARRLATMALPAALGGTGATVGWASGDTGQGLASGVALGALLAAGGTRAGQKAINAALFDRPGKAQALARAIRKKQGLFGSASLPFLITDY